MSEVLASLGDMFKMWNALSLNVGEFFAEIGSNPASTMANSSDLLKSHPKLHPTKLHKSWPLAKKSLTDGLRECLSGEPFNLKANLKDHSQETRIHYFISQSPELKAHSDFDHIAYFATAGFEQLLELTKEAANLNNADLSFGISERTNAHAKVEKSPSTEDLEFIFSKLEMLSIKHIAVCFLHSNLNSENERKIADFFNVKGLQVFCSSEEDKNLDELTRFRKTLMRARLGLRKNQIEKTFETLQAEFAGLQAFCLNSIPSPLKEIHLLEKYKPEAGTAHLDLGLENFLLKDSHHFWELKLSATSTLSSGFFHVPGFSNQSLSFDPGPMLMGKSFVPCLIDFLFAAEGFHSLEEFGLNPLNPEKTKARILEALLALVRNNQERRHIDLQKEILSLEKILACQLWSEMIVRSDFRKLKISGPLAKPLLKILKNYKPQGIEISLAENHDYFLTSVLEGIQV